MRKSKALAKLRQGKPILLAQMGYFIPPFVAHAAHAGFDAIWLDMEHRAWDDREVQALMPYFHLYDIDCLIRPATREKAPLYRYLEDGASGLIIPHVSNVDTARDLVSKVRFPPLGDRGIEGNSLETNFGIETGIADHANDETLLIVQIETLEALRNVEAIAEVEGIDGLYIGPGDLGLRMAQEPEANRLSIEEVMQRVAAACARNGKAWGNMPQVETMVEAQVALGAQLLVWGADITYLRAGLRTHAADLRRITHWDSDS
jgi:2-keto-3-deoxy-L-rhamnonate aldolase RhmA